MRSPIRYGFDGAGVADTCRRAFLMLFNMSILPRNCARFASRHPSIAAASVSVLSMRYRQISTAHRSHFRVKLLLNLSRASWSLTMILRHRGLSRPIRVCNCRDCHFTNCVGYYFPCTKLAFSDVQCGTCATMSFSVSLVTRLQTEPGCCCRQAAMRQYWSWICDDFVIDMPGVVKHRLCL